MSRHDWQDQALCAQVDPEIFFGDTGERDRTRMARLVCSSCPVPTECLEASFREPEGGLFGIRAGYTPRERAAIRRMQAKGRTA